MCIHQIVLACLVALAVADDKKSEVEAATQSLVADQDPAEWYGYGYYGSGYHGAYSPFGYGHYNPYGYSSHVSDGYYGPGHRHWRNRRSTNTATEKDQKAEENYYPGWGYDRGYYGGYPSYRPYSPSYYRPYSPVSPISPVSPYYRPYTPGYPSPAFSYSYSI